MDYPPQQNDEKTESLPWWEKDLPEAKEIRDKIIEEDEKKERVREEDAWWLREPKTEESHEKLIEQIKAIQIAQRGIPRWMIFAQFFAMLYIVVDIWFLYANITHSSAMIIGAYMIPLIFVLIHYIFILGQLKQIARGKK